MGLGRSALWYIYHRKDRCDRYDHWGVVSIWSQRSPIDRWDRTAVFLSDCCRNDRRDRYNRWRVVSICSQRSLNFFFSDRSDCGDRSDHMETSLKLFLAKRGGPSERSEVYKFVAWGSREYFFRRCWHSCLATKPNRDRLQLRTLMFLHFLLASLRTFACWHVYSSSVNELLD